jgi:hypothetical protein
MHYSSIQSAILSGTEILQILKDLASMELETKTLAQINAIRDLKEIGTLENVKLNQ